MQSRARGDNRTVISRTVLTFDYRCKVLFGAPTTLEIESGDKSPHSKSSSYRKNFTWNWPLKSWISRNTSCWEL